MRCKKSILLLVLTIFIFSIASVCASEANDTSMALADEQAIEVPEEHNDDILSVNENEDLVNENEQTFKQLNNAINNNSDADIYLNNDYKYCETEDSFKTGIAIDRDVNIYGNGHTIDANGKARIFEVKSGNVVFYNITFKNGNIGDAEAGGAIWGKCTAVNCIFINNKAYDGGAMYDGSAINCIFTKNNAGSFGGAMNGGSAVNCTFTENHASHAGGMDGGSAVNCTFIKNSATYGGGMQYGSAVNCTFRQNSGRDKTAAAYHTFLLNCNSSDEYSDCQDLILSFDVDNLDTTYHSSEKSAINLINQNGKEVNFINVNVNIFRKGVEVKSFSCLSGDELIFDLDIGSYTAELKITYPGLDPKTKTIDFTVTRGTPKIEVTASEVTYPEDIIVNVKSDVAGEYIVKVANQAQNVVLEAGVAQNITFKGFAANENGYLVNVTYDENENYTASINDTVKVVVHKATPAIEVTVNKPTYPNNLIVAVKTDVNGTYTVKVGDKSQIVVLEAGFDKNIVFSGLTANENGYLVNVTYDETENYTASINDTVKAVVHKATPAIEVTAMEVTYPNDLVVNVKVDTNGTYMVKVADIIQKMTFEAGVGQNVTFIGLAANENGYLVNVTYDETENYTASINDTIKVAVHRAIVKIEVTAMEATYPEDVVVNVKASRDGTYMVKVADQTQNVTLEAGVGKNITFTGLSANEKGYVVNATYSSENYTGVNDTVFAIIKKDSTKINASEITTTYNINKDLVITLTDSKGNPLTGKKIIVSLNSKKTYFTDKNGQIKVSTKGIVPNKYNAKITFDGDDNYLNSVNQVKVTIKKAKPKLTAKNKKFKKSKKVKKYTVTLKDNNKKPIKKAKVTLKIKGKKAITVKTNAKGKAIFKIKKLTKKGKYSSKVTFKGDKCYTKVAKKVKIILK